MFELLWEHLRQTPDPRPQDPNFITTRPQASYLVSPDSSQLHGCSLLNLRK